MQYLTLASNRSENIGGPTRCWSVSDISEIRWELVTLLTSSSGSMAVPMSVSLSNRRWVFCDMLDQSNVSSAANAASFWNWDSSNAASSYKNTSNAVLHLLHSGTKTAPMQLPATTQAKQCYTCFILKLSQLLSSLKPQCSTNIRELGFKKASP